MLFYFEDDDSMTSAATTPGEATVAGDFNFTSSLGVTFSSFTFVDNLLPPPLDPTLAPSPPPPLLFAVRDSPRKSHFRCASMEDSMGGKAAVEAGVGSMRRPGEHMGGRGFGGSGGQ